MFNMVVVVVLSSLFISEVVKADFGDNVPCYYAGDKYSNGSHNCQLGSSYVCSDGRWIKRGGSCAR